MSSSSGLSSYEIARNANIARNRLVLQSLGLQSAAAAVVLKPRVKQTRPNKIKRKKKTLKKKKKKRKRRAMLQLFEFLEYRQSLV